MMGKLKGDEAVVQFCFGHGFENIACLLKDILGFIGGLNLKRAGKIIETDTKPVIIPSGFLSKF